MNPLGLVFVIITSKLAGMNASRTHPVLSYKLSSSLLKDCYYICKPPTLLVPTQYCEVNATVTSSSFLYRETYSSWVHPVLLHSEHKHLVPPLIQHNLL